MARYLITGARAPVVWDIAVNLEKHGHRVYLADSLKNSIAKICPAIQSFHLLPSVRQNLKEYLYSLCLLLKQYRIDYLLPTCEEVFYISAIKNELSVYTEVICPNLLLLQKLHNKLTVLEITFGSDVLSPHTRVLKDITTPHSLDLSKYVLKKEYCRFGTDVKLVPSLADLGKARQAENSHNRNLLQEKIEGEEICCYAILTKGFVALCVCYLPKYRLGDSASIYFESQEDPQILEFLQYFAKNHNYSGQISFDFIRNSKGLFLLECNPRTTSGVHLCDDTDLATLLTVKSSVTWLPLESKTAQIKLAMLLFEGPRYLFSGQFNSFIKDFRKGRDIFGGKNQYSILKQQVLSLYELFCLAGKNRQSLRTVSTADIEWNGVPLDFTL